MIQEFNHLSKILFAMGCFRHLFETTEHMHTSRLTALIAFGVMSIPFMWTGISELKKSKNCFETGVAVMMMVMSAVFMSVALSAYLPYYLLYHVPTNGWMPGQFVIIMLASSLLIAIFNSFFR
jgi:hypothetical protein